MIGLANRLRSGFAQSQRSLLSRALSAIRRNGGTALYVPDDYAGAFIDSVGMPPVTAVGDYVGLLTDRSYGAGNLGGELVVNGGPFTNTTGWTTPIAGSVLSVAANELILTEGGTQNPSADFNIGAQVGKTYRVTAVIRKSPSATTSVRITVNGGSTVLAEVTNTTATSFSGTFTATNTGFLRLYAITSAGSGGQMILTNISVREVLGNHATQATTASKPLVTQLANGTKALDFDGSNDLLTLSSGAILQQGSDHWVTAAFVLDAVGGLQTIYSTASTTAAQALVCQPYVDGGDLRIKVAWREDSGTSVILSGPVASAGVPYVVTACRISGMGFLYVNGVLAASSSVAFLGATTVNTASIGASVRTTTTNYLNGKVIDLALGQTMLTETDRILIETSMARRCRAQYAVSTPTLSLDFTTGAYSVSDGEI